MLFTALTLEVFTILVKCYICKYPAVRSNDCPYKTCLGSDFSILFLRELRFVSSN